MMTLNLEREKLYVDSREPEKIFKMLERRKINYVKNFLPVGDFIFNNYVFERKNIIDFYNSVISGRLFEQVENMKENFENVFVLISGKFAECYVRLKKFNENIIYGTIASLVTKQKIQVLRVESDSQLIDQILKICEKSTESYSGFIKRVGLKDEDIVTSMISCIPGIGINKARLISERYTLRELFEVGVEELIKIEGIGEKIASKVKRFFK